MAEKTKSVPAQAAPQRVPVLPAPRGEDQYFAHTVRDLVSLGHGELKVTPSGYTVFVAVTKDGEAFSRVLTQVRKKREFERSLEA